MADEQGPGGGWLPPSDREYTPSGGPGSSPADDGAAGRGAAPSAATPALGGAVPLHGGFAPPTGAAGSRAAARARADEGLSQSAGWPAPDSPGQGTWSPSGHQARPGIPPAPGGSNGKATASLVFGIVGLLVCPLICSVVAVVLGHRSRNEIDASQGRQRNRGVATAGIVLGWIGIVIVVLGLLVFFVTSLAVEQVPSSEGGGDAFESRPSIVLGAQALARAAGFA
jgi:hypothetical protein